MHPSRRAIVATGAALGASLALGSCASLRTASNTDQGAEPRAGDGAGRGGPLWSISLAQWSLHSTLWKKELDNKDFAKHAKQVHGIDAIEYVNSFFKDKVSDRAYLDELKKRADDLGVRTLLVMIDGEGDLGHAPGAERDKALDNHRRWLDAAKVLGCHSIRVNAAAHGTPEEGARHAADCLRTLALHGDTLGLDVIVENHGGLSSDGSWLAGVMKLAAHPRVGTLPDFGNFTIGEGRVYDRYKGMEELMPFAKAVSAKSYDFDAKGDETTIDYRRMMKLVVAAGYRGHVGIEYEGSRLSEHDGIVATKKLLEAIRAEMS
ncbi:MAG: sugar phosphate isomerase/epimerase family protein [Planctomycetia bacterium]|jgi:sugar phosphate isomerase/epimerase